jgi:hypothetical protein
MRERAEMLNIVTELRGRLDELERMIKTAPAPAVGTPASFADEGVVDITPKEYRDFLAKGMTEAKAVRRYVPMPGFVQFGVPDKDFTVEVSSFPLSDLHRTGPGPGFGVRLAPLSEAPQAWFTYDFILKIKNAAEYSWLEWVIKLAFDQPIRSFTQFLIEGEGFSEKVDVGTTAISEFATFKHIKLDRATIEAACAGRALNRIRLTFSTAGVPNGLNVYGLSVFAKV